jgi:hypothetical protein
VRAAHPPERLAVELQSRVGPSLSHKGYRLVGSGPAGLMWRRDLAGKVLAGLIVLGLLALSGLASGQAGSIAFGLVCAAAAGLLFYFRRPASVMISLVRLAVGTEVTVTGGPDAGKAAELARTVAGPAPAAGDFESPRPTLAEPIARLVREARAREDRILEVIRHGEPVDDEIAAEVGGFMLAIDRTAGRAQLLYDALQDSPPLQVVGRLAEVRDDPACRELADALETQLGALRLMEQQINRFYRELERMLVELDTVRSHLVSMTASAESAVQQRVAMDVRELRERMGAVADGMRVAYEPRGS